MNNEFEVHTLNELGKERARTIAVAFNQLLNAISGPTYRREVKPGEGPDGTDLVTHDGPFGPICPQGRELAIVKTKLEEACFFAKKAMASLPENQEGYEPKGLGNPQSPPFNGFNRL